MVETEGIGSRNISSRRSESFSAGPRNCRLGLCTIAKPPWCQHFLQGFRLEKFPAEQSGIPPGHVLNCRSQRPGGIGHAHVGEVRVAELSRAPSDQTVTLRTSRDDITG